jgi:predicted nucleic acid-binding protein
MTLVIDASVALAWSIADESDREALALLKDVAAEGAVVPALWLSEMANGLRNAIRRGRISEAEALAIQFRLTQLPIRIVDVSERVVFHDALPLANRFNLSAYDATYLDVALRYRGRFVTRDRQLADAARRLGIAGKSNGSKRAK